MVPEYEKQVYTALTGKVIGVYLGRPFEGWWKKDIEAKWGSIDRYVHEDRNVPLVVADDDITGTFTFVKILADSGLYADTPERLFGENWLNYVLEGQTIFWWGGVSHSTEHTAFLNLKHGVEAPESGSMALNGREVSEQIGAQIFIDAFGMVAPGRPDLAVDLAGKAARVSHDGEAVHAAQVVAAMVSLAFVEKDMNRLLDAAVAFIPEQSLIAQVHRDVRAWAKEDGDWRKTYDRIDERYGYHRYGGNCHVVPNHAIMVMAWACAQRDFFEAMRIICTAGWDTDCNAANVGSVSALVAGLDRLGDRYDFRTPFADRILLPTADGTDTITDVLRQAMGIAAIGRRVMGMPALPPPKGGALHHFEMPGAVHGYLATPGSAAVNASAPQNFSGERCLSFRFSADANQPARIETPILFESGNTAGYSLLATPRLCNGMTVRTHIACVSTSAPATLRLFARDVVGGIIRSEPQPLQADDDATLAWQIVTGPSPLLAFGFEIEADEPCSGDVRINFVDFGGTVRLEYANSIPHQGPRHIPGWISNLDLVRGRFSSDPHELMYFGKNEGQGMLVTGGRQWRDCTMRCGFQIHAAARAGVLLRYQGMRRHYAVVFTKTTLQIIRNHYGETLLAETPFAAEENRLHQLDVSARDNEIRAAVEGGPTLAVHDAAFGCGGVGFTIERGLAGFRALEIKATTK
ncbi:MAG: ADP-ribosylglycohydrolase family protein [Kiritimatiellia bacterium]|jgi:ADP-ribosylglycohydrolase